MCDNLCGITCCNLGTDTLRQTHVCDLTTHMGSHAALLALIHSANHVCDRDLWKKYTPPPPFIICFKTKVALFSLAECQPHALTKSYASHTQPIFFYNNLNCFIVTGVTGMPLSLPCVKPSGQSWDLDYLRFP